MKAPTIFFTGISASGKSTLGKILKEDLEENGTHNIIFLDGEDMRMKFKERGKHFGFSNEEFERLVDRIMNLLEETSYPRRRLNRSRTTLRRFISRGNPDEGEYEILMGIFKAIKEGKR